MRLKKFDTSKIKVRSNSGRPMPGRKAGGIGIGTLIIAVIGFAVFGINPMQTFAVMDGMQQSAPADTTAQSGDLSEQQICTSGPYAREACDALLSLNQTWSAEFSRSRIDFEEPTLNLFPSGQVTTQGCGSASSAAGPFYCPADYTIYIDTTFFDQLANMAGTGGDFARLYVMAHEYGHHLQNLLGTAAQVRAAKQRNPAIANQLQVRMELQADCYAGVWAGMNRNRIERGDIEEGLKAASSIGDDTLQRNAGRRIDPENFTHGTSQQRMTALQTGLESADGSACKTYFDFS